MAKQTHPVRNTVKKAVGKPNAKNKKPRSKIDITRQIKIQKALYEIADAASAVTDMQAFYRRVHEIVGKLMYVGNFFIATYDEQSDLITWTYYVDTMDVKPSPVHLSDQHGATGWILRHGKTLADVDGSVAKAIKQGEIKPIGTDSDGIGVPLKSDDKMIGVLIVQSYKPDIKYTLEDIEILNFVAQHISTAMTRARAMEETRERNAELQIINSVQEGLASKLDITAIYELIGEKVRDVFNVQVIDIVNYDPIANLISMPYSYEKGDRSVITPREPYGFRQQVITSRAPLLINQNFVEMASKYNNPLLTGAWPKSALFVPLLVDGKVRSIISIQDLDRENAFSVSDVQLLQTLSNAMSIALENARLFEETQHLLKETEQRAQELATVNTVSAALAGELDLNALIELVGEQIRTVFKADIAFVALLDKEKGIINFSYQYGQHIEPIQWGQGITSKIIQSGQPLIINRDMDRQRQRMGVTLLGKRARSFLGVPIFVGGESVGVVSVQHSEQEEIFTDDDQRLLSTIATNVGIALQNARLFDETQRAFQAERQAHEQTETLHSVAQALNRSLSLREVFDLVLIEIQKVIPYDSAGIYQVQGNRRVFVTGRGFSNLDDLIGVGFEFNQQDDEIGYLISKSLQPLVLEDATKEYPQYFSTGSHAATKIRSYMAVPIVLNQTLIGMITLDREEPGIYKDQHAELAMAFAAQAATAINNARLFDETQHLLKETEQRNRELSTINKIQQTLASKLDFQSIIDLFGNEIMRIFPPEEGNAQHYTVFIALYDDQTNLLSFPYLINGEGVHFTQPAIKLGTGLTSTVIQSGESLVLKTRDEQIAHGLVEFADERLRGKYQSWLGVPIRSGDRVIGVFSVEDPHPDLFTESDVRLLSTLAASLGVALENARLFDETQRLLKETEQRNRELAIINRIQKGLASKLDVQAMMDLFGDELTHIFPPQERKANNYTVFIALYNPQTKLIQFPYLIDGAGNRFMEPPTELGPGLTSAVIRSGNPLVLNTLEEQVAHGVITFTQEGIRIESQSWLGVPIKSGEEVIGVISMQDQRPNLFAESDVRLLSTLASSLKVALENARLWEQERMFRKALERELEIGREIQAGFLPETLPQVEGWEIAASLMSAREVAGDFYDAFELPDGNIGLVIADVCDKGVGAALFMTLFRSLIRAVANLDYFEHTEQANANQSTTERLQRAISLTNNYIAETHGESGMFATLFFGILDPYDGKLIYINGGHEPPLVIRAGKVYEALNKTGPAVGAIMDCNFGVHESWLHEGDMLLAFTDGVMDCQNPHGDFFEREQLLTILQRITNSSRELISAIETDLRNYIANATQLMILHYWQYGEDGSLFREDNVQVARAVIGAKEAGVDAI